MTKIKRPSKFYVVVVVVDFVLPFFFSSLLMFFTCIDFVVFLFVKVRAISWVDREIQQIWKELRLGKHLSNILY